MKQLELVDDGTIIVRTKLQTWTLERPTLGQLRELVERAAAADKALRDAVEAVKGEGQAKIDEQVRVSGEIQLGTVKKPALYGALVRGFVEMLAEGDPPDVADLPSWAVSGRAASRMIAHWRAVPLDLGPDE